MAVQFGGVIKLIAKILSPALALASAIFRDKIKEFIIDGYAQAKQTENPWDDFLFELLASLFAVSLPDK